MAVKRQQNNGNKNSDFTKTETVESWNEGILKVQQEVDVPHKTIKLENINLLRKVKGWKERSKYSAKTRQTSELQPKLRTVVKHNSELALKYSHHYILIATHSYFKSTVLVLMLK